MEGAKRVAARGAPAKKVRGKAPTAQKPRVAAARSSAVLKTPVAVQQETPPDTPLTLSEEQRIESAKYSEVPQRVFEEERFLFPETYGRNRVRLLVKDPQWLFAYWDVDPGELRGLRDSIGERATALSRLTLKISDVNHGGTSVILLPEGARSWYVRADETRRSYRAELGITLPSGEFRRLAVSNTVTTPRVGPSSVAATRVLSYRKAGELSAADASGVDEHRAASASGPGPWSAPLPEGTTLNPGARRGRRGRATASGEESEAESEDRPEHSGASETFRR
jgi:hypothetical protein